MTESSTTVFHPKSVKFDLQIILGFTLETFHATFGFDSWLKCLRVIRLVSSSHRSVPSIQSLSPLLWFNPWIISFSLSVWGSLLLLSLNLVIKENRQRRRRNEKSLQSCAWKWNGEEKYIEPSCYWTGSLEGSPEENEKQVKEKKKKEVNESLEDFNALFFLLSSSFKWFLRIPREQLEYKTERQEYEISGERTRLQFRLLLTVKPTHSQSLLFVWSWGPFSWVALFIILIISWNQILSTWFQKYFFLSYPLQNMSRFLYGVLVVEQWVNLSQRSILTSSLHLVPDILNKSFISESPLNFS